MKVRLKEIGGAFFLQFISRWRVLDGGCPSLNKVDIVVLIWSSGDDLLKVHYPSWCLVTCFMPAVAWPRF